MKKLHLFHLLNFPDGHIMKLFLLYKCQLFEFNRFSFCECYMCLCFSVSFPSINVGVL